MKKFFFLPFFTIALAVSAAAKHNSDDIIGNWMNCENNIEVEIFKTGNEYKARVIWFDDSDDKSRPVNSRCDRKNPNEALRSRKVVGLEVMHGLVYNPSHDEWQHGRIYDASSGKDWSAKAWLTKDDCLEVRGFWHFEIIGQNMCFKKVS